MHAPSPFVRRPETTELRWMGETFTYFLADGRHTAGAFSLIDEQARRGETVPLHRHEHDMESFYVLDGEITFFLDGQPGVRATRGTFVHVPGGVTHGFRIESETARYLILTTPRHGEFYRAITLPSREGNLPPEDATVPGAVIGQACATYGIEFVGPLPV